MVALGESWDNMNFSSPPDLHWSTDNVGEAAPGVLSPLGASIWATYGELDTRRVFVEMGVLPRSEDRLSTGPGDRIVSIFYGRIAIKVEMMTTLGDRLPGTTGEDIAKSMLGTVPETIEYHPTARYYPRILYKTGRTFFGMPKRLQRECPEYERFWRESINRLPGLDAPATRALLADACAQFEAALLLQSLSVPGHTQLIYEALSGVVEKAGTGDMGILSGTGGAELDVITDIWRAAQGQATLDDVIAKHGFHGPLEGEVSSVVWRENRAPLERLIDEYAKREDPRAGHAAALVRLAEEQERVLNALPRAARPAARRVLRSAAWRLPMRGIGKRSFLQGLDVIRGCARHLSTELRELDDPSDAFYLTLDELRGELPSDVRDLVAKRRERRAYYQSVSIPGAWKGIPEPIAVEERDEPVTRVEGIGVSAGVVEGVAHVVLDPAMDEIEPDEILVAPTTDPSWASIMYISAGLVVDMGGPISHAAVVARELGLPCVVNTRTGTRDIKTGDRLRVDGGTGAVEILRDDPVAGG